MPLPTVYFAIPAMDELDFLPKTLECIARQDYKGRIETFVCVNQPQSDYSINPLPQRVSNNKKLWQMLEENPWRLSLHPIDRFSNEKAWRTASGGVGTARQCCMDEIVAEASGSDILISMDADTQFDAGYVSQMVEYLEKRRKTDAVLPQYHHRLSGSEAQDRAMLRYEIYMRCYLFNLQRIGSPYAFTALGSAICCRIGAYRKCGGFDSRQAGEDFYFLQKIVKSGRLELHPACTVYPSSRISDRVPFGTGPAIRQIGEGGGPYPVFPPEAFDLIDETYRLLPLFREGKVTTPLTSFIDESSCNPAIWEKLRKNYPELKSFTKAFHQKADGLRIFQFLRHYAECHPATDEENLLKTLVLLPHPEELPPLPEDFSLATAPIQLLDDLRNILQKAGAAIAAPAFI